MFFLTVKIYKMNTKNSIILFLILIITHFFGNKTFVVSFYENNYLLNFMEVIVFLLTIFFAIYSFIKLIKKYNK
jgi:Mn2+/Fe2+ NRAMP family transporter